MPGDSDNVRIWLDADVAVADVGATAPTNVTDALAAGWDYVGLLSEDGMAEGREEERTDHYAWGGTLVRTTRSKHKRTIKVTALEDNPVVRSLVEPAATVATAGGVTTRTVKAPGPNPKAFVFETVDGTITRRRYVPRGEAFLDEEVAATETEPSKYVLTVNIYPDDDEVLYLDISDDPQWVEGSGS